MYDLKNVCFIDSSECGKTRKLDSFAKKSFTFIVKRIEDVDKIPTTIALVVLIFFMFGLLVFIMMTVYFQRYLLPRENFLPEDEKKNADSKCSQKKLRLLREKAEKHIKKSESASDNHQRYPKYLHDLWDKAEMQNKKTCSYERIHVQNQMYSWLVLIMATCYSIPAVQMVIKQQKTISGNQAKIYNFLLQLQITNHKLS